MSQPLATGAAQTALIAAKKFAAALPPSTGADLIQLVQDLAQGVKAELNAAIFAGAPDIPVLRNFVAGEMVKIADDTVDNLVDQLSAAIQGADR